AGYMAPEQALGTRGAASKACDIYSLGAVLYEMLTGRAPFQAATLVETLKLVIETEPVPVRRFNPTVCRDLETICMKCLRKDPRMRYVSAEALADDLNRFQLGEPIKARPVSAAERAGKWILRHPSTTALLAVTTACVILVAAFVGWRESRLNYEVFFHVGDLE